MTKEVIISISSKQSIDGEDNEPIELITPGRYYLNGGYHFLLFDMVMEGESEVTKTRLRFNESEVLLTRRGPQRLRMLFQKDKRDVSMYRTPFGTIMMGVSTKKIRIKEEEDQVALSIHYALDVEDAHYADHRISVVAQSRNSSEISL